MFINPSEKKNLSPGAIVFYDKGAQLFADGKPYDGPAWHDCITDTEQAYLSGYYNAEQSALLDVHRDGFSHADPEKMTPAEAAALQLIERRFNPGEDFKPEDLYPGRNNQDNAGRRTITRLYRKGVIKKSPNIPAEPWATGVYQLKS